MMFPTTPRPTPNHSAPGGRWRSLVALVGIVALLGLGSTAPLCAMGGSGDRCAMGETTQLKADPDGTSRHHVAPKVSAQPSTPPCHGAPSEPVERLSGLCCCSLDAAPMPPAEVASLTSAPNLPVAFDVDGSPVFRPRLCAASPAQEVPARPPAGRALLALHSILLL